MKRAVAVLFIFVLILAGCVPNVPVPKKVFLPELKISLELPDDWVFITSAPGSDDAILEYLNVDKEDWSSDTCLLAGYNEKESGRVIMSVNVNMEPSPSEIRSKLEQYNEAYKTAVINDGGTVESTSVFDQGGATFCSVEYYNSKRSLYGKHYYAANDDVCINIFFGNNNPELYDKVIKDIVTSISFAEE